ncbi:rCG23845 [Rattus norvegicus]|uniref:RCG23845 n=1 Tax=Rattus norvegicus TaxID=10116 RepID=A6JWI1_RAT|nr:rCG23845 [Rattus norvegicus]
MDARKLIQQRPKCAGCASCRCPWRPSTGESGRSCTLRHGFASQSVRARPGACRSVSKVVFAPPGCI